MKELSVAGKASLRLQGLTMARIQSRRVLRDRGGGAGGLSTPQGIAWSNAESTVHRATAETFSSLGEPMCSSSCLNKAFLSNFPLLFAES